MMSGRQHFNLFLNIKKTPYVVSTLNFIHNFSYTHCFYLHI